KNIRRTVTIVATEGAKIDQVLATDEARKAALAKQIEEWTKTAARYRSEPEAAHGLGEGTIELAKRAKDKEHERDVFLNKYHYFEYASAALQIGIVLCSAAVITGAMALVWLAGGTGLIGLALMMMGFFFSHIHLLPGGHWAGGGDLTRPAPGAASAGAPPCSGDRTAPRGAAAASRGH